MKYSRNFLLFAHLPGSARRRCVQISAFWPLSSCHDASMNAFFNWCPWASAAVWWIFRLQSIHSSLSVVTNIYIWQKAVPRFIILHRDLGPQFGCSCFTWDSAEEQGRSGRRTAAFQLTEHCRDNKVPGSRQSQRWRKNPTLLIIYWSNWLWSEAAAADSICSHFPWTVREVNRAKSLLGCRSVVHKRVLLVFSLISLWGALLGVSFLTFPAH